MLDSFKECEELERLSVLVFDKNATVAPARMPFFQSLNFFEKLLKRFEVVRGARPDPKVNLEAIVRRVAQDLLIMGCVDHQIILV